MLRQVNQGAASPAEKPRRVMKRVSSRSSWLPGRLAFLLLDRDQLDFGFIAGANIIPHVQVLCDMLPLEFDALEAAYAPPPSEIKGAAE